MKTYFAHLLTCSDAGAKKTCYAASDDLRKEIKYYLVGRELLKAIKSTCGLD